MPTVYVYCPDSQIPHGGNRMLYRHVDVLVQAGYNAFAVHQDLLFRYSWFENTTQVTCLRDRNVKPDDIVVIPETCGPWAHQIKTKNRRVIYNQNCYQTFCGDVEGKIIQVAYRHPSVIAVLTVSEDSTNYLRYAFPGLTIQRIYLGIDSRLFFPRNRTRTIAYMPRKNGGHAKQVIAILNHRQRMNGYLFVKIDGCSEKEVAKILGCARIFLSLSELEGCPLPPMEAMASGCLVVGYHGGGGREYMGSDRVFSIESGDIVEFCKAIEMAAELWDHQALEAERMTDRARHYVLDTYSMERERGSILQFWKPHLD